MVTATWQVYEEEKLTRDWVDIPDDYIGTPIAEHAKDYITILDTGERVMVRKTDNYVLNNLNANPFVRSRKL